jgi:hypothetical protein
MLRSIGRWKRDAEAASCEDCHVSFGLLTRRHHCRSCGGIFCSTCSESTIVILLVDATTPQRVCNNCFRRLRAPAKGSQPPPTRPAASGPDRPWEAGRAACNGGQPPNPNGLVESKSGETDSQPTRRNTQTDEDTTCHGCTTHEPHPTGEVVGDGPADDDSSSDDGMGPPRIDLSSLSSLPHHSNHSLSFLSTLQDSLKQRDADNVVSVLIYAGEGKEQSLVTDVRDGETMRQLADRLAPLYFKLMHPPFRRMDEAALEALRSELRFYTEYQVVAPATAAEEVARHCKKLVLSTLQFPALQDLFRSAASGHSVRSFLRSEHSERAVDAALGSERFDD